MERHTFDAVITIIPSLNLLALIGLIFKIWGWAAKMEIRISILEVRVEEILSRNRAYDLYNPIFKRKREEDKL